MQLNDSPPRWRAGFNELINKIRPRGPWRIQRHPAGRDPRLAPPGQCRAAELDAQGKSRIYLEESRKQAEANKLGAVPMYAAQMKLEGVPCAK